LRTTIRYSIKEQSRLKEAALTWAQQYTEVVWLDSNKYKTKYSSFDAILAVDGLTSISTDTTNAFKKLSDYQTQTNDWIFGYLSYDLKNDVERLESKNPDKLKFPELHFFQPKKIIKFTENTLQFCYLIEVAAEIAPDLQAIKELHLEDLKNRPVQTAIPMHARISKEEYLHKIVQILEHIQRGDLYEVNFCQEFYAEASQIHPLATFQKLNDVSKAPFAAYLRLEDKFIMCTSPERYLKNTGGTVISQPIKGTAARSRDKEEDAKLKLALVANEKERSENVMIVDLVRNDLSKSAMRGSVQVEELYKVATFKQVHQMISTITAKYPQNKNAVEILKDTFPMGSMTGAPKVAAMQLMERLESFKRGIYSGAVGYFTPNGDFDFNVVIRSILYNQSNEYISYAVGSAITAKSIPQQEYEECLLKAKAMREVLGN